MRILKYIGWILACMVFLVGGWLLSQYQQSSASIPPNTPPPSVHQENASELEEPLAASAHDIQEIPISLDETTDLHLKEFRDQAKALAQSYPHAFFVSAACSEKKAALTFDDGPDSITTPVILNILKTHQVRATFFLLGNRIENYTDVVEQMVSEGHQVANHSWSHPRPLDMSPQELLAEIEHTDIQLPVVKDGRSSYFRPPYGLVTPEQMNLLAGKGHRVIAWSIDSMDWYTQDPKKIEQCVLETLHPGAIILMHSSGGPDNRQATLEALPEIIQSIKDFGYQLVTVDELLSEEKGRRN